MKAGYFLLVCLWVYGIVLAKGLSVHSLLSLFLSGGYYLAIEHVVIRYNLI
jgi:hypothetical protein